MKSGQGVILKQIKRDYQLYVLLAIPVFWVVIFKYWPLYGAQIAFKDFRPGDTFESAKWVGFDNFIKFFRNYQFWVLLRNTLGLTLYNLVVGFPIPILFALALNITSHGRFRKVTQFVTYMPYFISTVVMVAMLMQFLNTRTGALNNIIATFGGRRVDFLGSTKMFSSLYVWSDVWQKTGWNSIVYLAALSSVSSDLHEAAKIDGASRFMRVLHVDIPGILPTMIVLLILNTGFLMTVGFEKIFLMQNPMNMGVSQVISTYVYTVGLKNAPPQFSYGTAIDLFNSVISLAMIVTVNHIAKKHGGTSLW
jgi:ABC-type polysaccharide transport system permease subunit